MKEVGQNFGSLFALEFDQLVEPVASPDFNDLPMSAFATALAAIDAEAASESVVSVTSATSMTNPIAHYLQQIEKALAKGNATEHTHRPALKTLVESFSKNITATNEPKRV